MAMEPVAFQDCDECKRPTLFMRKSTSAATILRAWILFLVAPLAAYSYILLLNLDLFRPPANGLGPDTLLKVACFGSALGFLGWLARSLIADRSAPLECGVCGDRR
jgi:hypothetical protein